VLALEALAQRPYTSVTQAKREVVAAVKAVAAKLSNTPAVCRKCYIHPRVIDTYLEAGPAGLPSAEETRAVPGLSGSEARLLALLGRIEPRRASRPAPPRTQKTPRKTSPEAVASRPWR
jgi:DNA topoisomerase-1